MNSPGYFLKEVVGLHKVLDPQAEPQWRLPRGHLADHTVAEVQPEPVDLVGGVLETEVVFFDCSNGFTHL